MFFNLFLIFRRKSYKNMFLTFKNTISLKLFSNVTNANTHLIIDLFPFHSKLYFLRYLSYSNNPPFLIRFI